MTKEGIGRIEAVLGDTKAFLTAILNRFTLSFPLFRPRTAFSVLLSSSLQLVFPGFSSFFSLGEFLPLPKRTDVTTSASSGLSLGWLSLRSDLRRGMGGLGASRLVCM